MFILGVNISHHPSICFHIDGKVKEFYNEERFVNIKDYEAPKEDFHLFRCIEKKIKKKPDFVVYASWGRNSHMGAGSDQYAIDVIQKQLKHPKYYFNPKEHHLYHAITGFAFSKFDEAAAIVVDGGGAAQYIIPYKEVESIYYINKKEIYPFYKHSTNIMTERDAFGYSQGHAVKMFKGGCENMFSNYLVGGNAFADACYELGYKNGNYSGKVMGLSSYGYTDKKYPLNYEFVEIAKNVQEKTFIETCELIDRAKEKSKNIVLSGGYFLNCSNNFKYVKKYPDLNFFVDPVPIDSGTAIGAAIYYDKYKR